MVTKNYFHKKIIKKAIFIAIILIITFDSYTMNKNMPFAIPSPIVHSIGTCMAGLGLAALITDPTPTLWSTCMNAGCILMSLHKFLSDVPVVRESLHKITVPLVGACLAALRTRDTHRSVGDHIRALSIGALVTAGAAQLTKRLFYSGKEYDAYAWGLIMGGALLLSQKDLKSFFGFQKGHSLNPPSEIKALVKQVVERKINIDRVILKRAEEGRIQSLPFIMRLWARFRPEYEDETPSQLFVSESDFVTTILPYLRSEIEPCATKNQSQNVFSTDRNKYVVISAELIKKYLSIDAYNYSNKS